MEGTTSKSMDTEFRDLRQTGEWASYLKLIGWRVAGIRNQGSGIRNFLYIKKLPLLPFSVAKLQRPRGNIDWEEIKKIRKKYRIIHLITREMVASKTIWVDLRKFENKLLSEMKPKTRYNIGLARRKSIRIKVIKGKEILETGFFDLIRQNARRIKIFALPKNWYEAQVKAFGEKCFAVLGFFDNQLVAGNFFMTSSNACFYSHNGSTALGRTLMAPSLCVWEGILEAKRRKLTIFDFDGVDDGSHALKRWKGFTRFKEGFGGEKIIFA